MNKTDIDGAVRFWSNFDNPAELLRKATDDYAGGMLSQKEGLWSAAAIWGWYWAEDGFWNLTCGAKYAAALMCTNTAGAKGEVVLPGRAIKITLPEGVIPGYRFVYLSNTPQGAVFVATVGQMCGAVAFPHDSAAQFDRPGRTLSAAASTADDLLFVTDDSRLETGAKREGVLLRRLVIGLLWTMQHTANFSSRSYRTAPPIGGPIRNGPPDHRVVFVGSPIAVDSRPQIRDWLLGETSPHGPPSVQSIVRGHYKRQPVGAGHTGRKVIWVEPYWRGPEDAPILVHPRKLGQ